MIVLDGVGMTYRAESGPVEALRDIELTVGRGELVALVGPSGCGKSTLLRVVAGLRPATTGTVVVDGRPVTRPIPAVGMVFQAPVLLKWRTVRDNVLLAAELAGLAPSDYRERAEALLRLVGLHPVLEDLRIERVEIALHGDQPHALHRAGAARADHAGVEVLQRMRRKRNGEQERRHDPGERAHLDAAFRGSSRRTFSPARCAESPAARAWPSRSMRMRSKVLRTSVWRLGV